MLRKLTLLTAAITLAVGLGTAQPAQADFAVVSNENEFRALVDGRELRRFAVRLQVHEDGTISGTGFGRQVTGDWGWQGRYFCRTLTWGSGADPDNCQLVLRDGNTLRFISNQGQGDSADFRLR